VPRRPWSKILEVQYARPSTNFHRNRVAKALGLRNATNVPKGMTIGELLAWQTTVMAMEGDPHARNAVLDRVAPKPKRLEIEVGVKPGRGSVDDEPGAAEAEEYMEALAGEEPE
jgi:hypothetical protein